MPKVWQESKKESLSLNLTSSSNYTLGGSSSTYVTLVDSPGFGEQVGPVNVRYRTVVDQTSGSPTIGAWDDFGFTLETATTSEITLLDAGSELTSGSSVDLGTTLLGTPLSRTWTITNSGSGPLVLDLMALQIPAGFQLTSYPDSTVGVGGSTTFTLQLTAAWPGDYHGTFVLPNNDAAVRDIRRFRCWLAFVSGQIECERCFGSHGRPLVRC